MPWVLVDVLIGVVAIVALLAALLNGFLRVKALIRTSKAASAQVTAAMPPAPQPRS